MREFSLNIKGRLLTFDRPAVMGIINVTPDSFYAASRAANSQTISTRAAEMVAQGVDIIDLGAYSSRPGADDVSAEEESRRLRLGIEAIRSAVGPDVPVSVDTFRASVARDAIEWGADIVNDISGGLLDPEMFSTVAALRCPYVLMHMRGNPATMQSLTDYPSGVTQDVIDVLSRRIGELEELGVADIIVDPGFGFAKTTEQNFELFSQLEAIEILHRPILVGVSRKSMITRTLAISSEEAGTATAVMGAFALDRGASILRVHDVEAAVQSVRLWKCLNN
ncbi:MAG: dihydropteroate synthase [Bacteroidales bacterium]|nr:dihydropteroate synthase [Bacteroidales bacterium]